MSSAPLVHVLRAGKLDYTKALALQTRLARGALLATSSATGEANHQQRNVIILTEHSPTYTIGIRHKGYSADEAERLRALGATFHKTNRGGLITFHGPGQLIAYPIINLKQFQPSIRWYVCQLERTIIELCRRFELPLPARTSPDTGVWIEDRKICAIGLHVSRYVTMHGLALNCDTDLGWFEHIVPCGLEGKGVTSLSKELRRSVKISDTTDIFLQCFADILQCNLKELNDDETKIILDESL